MSGLTEGRNTHEIANSGRTLVLPVAAGAKIFEGSLVVLDGGFAKAATKAADLTAAGRAEEFADNTNGAAGAVTVVVQRGVYLWDNSTTPAEMVKPEHVLKDCYIADDHTVTATETGSSVAGKVIAVSDDGVAVETL